MSEKINIGDYNKLGLIKIDVNDPVSNNAAPILNWLIGFAALVAVVFIIISAYTLITAAGNPDQIAKGQGGLTASIVGLIIVFIAKVVIDLVVQRVYS